VNQRLIARLAFAAYALLLFTLTHIPNVKIEATWRPDLLMHLVAFGGWTLFLILAGFFGPVFSFRNIASAAALGAAYGAIDEALQAIPFIHRHAAVDDWLADCLGVALGCAAALILRFLWRSDAQA
jgi:VanZ family protein